MNYIIIARLEIRFDCEKVRLTKTALSVLFRNSNIHFVAKPG